MSHLNPEGGGTFFEEVHFDRWLEWIRRAEASNESARLLSDWLRGQRAALRSLIDAQKSHVRGVGQLRLLDIGCGAGRYAINLLNEDPAISIVGVDISPLLVAEANSHAREAKLEHRATFLVMDAASLSHEDIGAFDIVFCVTNVVGNLAQDGQASLIRGIASVLKDEGRAFFSVYSEESTAVRIESYAAVGLEVEHVGRHLRARQGLVSQSFSMQEIRGLINNNGLRVVDGPYRIAEIGWKVVGAKR